MGHIPPVPNCAPSAPPHAVLCFPLSCQSCPPCAPLCSPPPQDARAEQQRLAGSLTQRAAEVEQQAAMVRALKEALGRLEQQVVQQQEARAAAATPHSSDGGAAPPRRSLAQAGTSGQTQDSPGQGQEQVGSRLGGVGDGGGMLTPPGQGAGSGGGGDAEARVAEAERRAAEAEQKLAAFKDKLGHAKLKYQKLQVCV